MSVEKQELPKRVYSICFSPLRNDRAGNFRNAVFLPPLNNPESVFRTSTRSQYFSTTEARGSIRVNDRERTSHPVLTRFRAFFFSASFLPLPWKPAGFQRAGGCKDDISMVYIKAVFVFSIRLIRTVTRNTAS